MAEQMNSPVRRRRRWPFFFLLALAAVSLLLHAAQIRRSREISELGRQYADLVRARPIAETRARRARFFKSRFYLGYPAAASHAAADLVRRIVPISRTVRLRAIQVDPGLHDLGFELTIEVAAAGPKAARRKLAFFLERLRDLPGVFQARPSPASPGAGGGRVFIIKGRAELT
jgi:hypothetical protein